MSDKFPDILEEAQRVPSIDEDIVRSPFDRPLPRGDRYESKVIEPKPQPKYEYTARIQRFVIGIAQDDSADYETVINQALSGEIIVRYEERTFSKEGDVIIVLSWMVPKKKAATATSKLNSSEGL